MKKLSLKVLNKCSKDELKKMDKLEKKFEDTRKLFQKAQDVYGKAANANKPDMTLRRLADKGFYYEKKFFELDDEITKFKNDLNKKYK